MSNENVYQFIDLPRTDPSKKSLEVRKKEFVEIYRSFTETQAQSQSDRCLSCGNPYCQHRCPLHNNIPDWLRLAHEGRWFEAAELAHGTNSLPEVCGRVCPQDRLCEGSCSLNAEFGAVTIGAMEKHIMETALAQGWKPRVRAPKNGRKAAVVGSGPAGLACADVLIRNGVEVTVFEREEEIGGLLTFGIPAFKLEKNILIRRREILSDMGVRFRLGTEIGRDLDAGELEENHDAVFLGLGTYRGMPADIPGEDALGVSSALPFLIGNTKKIMGLPAADDIDVRGLRVVVLGGGDTAMDCMRTALRCGASEVTCVYRRDEVDMPGSKKEVQNAREEGGVFLFNAQPLAVESEKGRVAALKIVRTRPGAPDEKGRRRPEVVPGSEESIACDVILVAFGFAPHDIPWLSEIGVAVDARGRIALTGELPQQTANPKVFAGGDITRGSDLVVTAVAEGRAAAQSMLRFWNA